MDSTGVLLVLLAAIVIGWFAIGTIYNLRRGGNVLRWMQGGLPRLGARTSLRWLGSSVAQLEIAKARAPFKRVELALVLEPRDVPWFWLPARLRGRRDLLILRADLARAPAGDFDLLAPGSWSARMASTRNAWAGEPLAGAEFRAPEPARAAAREPAAAALRTAQVWCPTVWRLSARRGVPHFELHVPLPDPRTTDARRFFDGLAALAEELSA